MERLVLNIFLLCILLAACGPSAEEKKRMEERRLQCIHDEQSAENEILEQVKSSFDKPFPKRNINLSNILGDTFSILGNCCQLNFRIISNRKSNTIIDLETDKTIFTGTVSKYKGHYYLSEQLDDTTYRISAMQIGTDSIYGFQKAPQYVQVDAEIEKGNDVKLIKYIDMQTHAIRLHPDKKALRKLFDKISPNTKAFKIIQADKTPAAFDRADENITDPEDLELVASVYPNPGSDYINVELQQQGKSTYNLIDVNGNITLSGQLNEKTNQLNLQNQKAGSYLLCITNTEGNQKEVIKIIKID